MTRILISEIDASKNVITPHSAGGYFESRYVQRKDDNFIIYLSSHNGCNYSCRFCHLTQSKQVAMIPGEMNMYLHQAKEALKFYTPDDKIHTVSWSLMARGEPLANHIVLDNSWDLIKNLTNIPETKHLHQKVKISSIIPNDFRGDLKKIFEHPASKLYYSLYSVNPVFRKRWLPKAMDPSKALDLIKEMQLYNGKEIVLHWALIDGQNTDFKDIYNTIKAVTDREIRAKFNLVRYNSHSEKTGAEPSEQDTQDIFNFINHLLPNDSSKIVSRVGTDVAASCGMFYNGE